MDEDGSTDSDCVFLDTVTLLRDIISKHMTVKDILNCLFTDIMVNIISSLTWV